MKTITILILSLFIFKFAVLGQEKEVKISGNFIDESFHSVVSSIEENFSVRFFYAEKDVKQLVVNSTFTDASVSDFMNQLLEGTSLHFAVQKNRIFIYPGDIIQPLFLISEKEETTIEEKTKPAI